MEKMLPFYSFSATTIQVHIQFVWFMHPSCSTLLQKYTQSQRLKKNKLVMKSKQQILTNGMYTMTMLANENL